MPIIKKQKVEATDKVSITLTKEMIAMLLEYADYVNADRHFVVSEALRYVIDKDTEFIKSQHPSTARQAKASMGHGA